MNAYPYCFYFSLDTNKNYKELCEKDDECDGSQYLTCSIHHGYCICKNDFHWDSTNSVCCKLILLEDQSIQKLTWIFYKAARKLHGENCEHSDECSIGFHCKENFCSCGNGYHWDKDKEECG